MEYTRSNFLDETTLFEEAEEELFRQVEGSSPVPPFIVYAPSFGEPPRADPRRLRQAPQARAAAAKVRGGVMMTTGPAGLFVVPSQGEDSLHPRHPQPCGTAI